MGLSRQHLAGDAGDDTHGADRDHAWRLLAVPVALLCAGNLIKSRCITYPVRFVLNLVRTIPDLLLAAFCRHTGTRSTAGYLCPIRLFAGFDRQAHL